MKYALTLLAVITFLAWSLLVTFGLVSFALSDPELIGIALAAFYCAGLGASIWVGFFAADSLSIATALALEFALLLVALFTLSGGVTLLEYWLWS